MGGRDVMIANVLCIDLIINMNIILYTHIYIYNIIS